MHVPESEFVERCALEDLHAAADENDKQALEAILVASF